MPRDILSSVTLPSHIWARNSGEIAHPEGLWALRAMTFAAFRPKNNLCCQQQAERVNGGCQSWTWSFSRYPPHYLSTTNPSLMGLLLNSSHVSTHLEPTGAWESLQILSLFVLNYIIPEVHFCLAFPHLYFSFRKPYLWVHACTYVCTCACKCVCVWTWICSDIVPQEESTLHFLNRVSDWNLGFPFNWASLTIKFQGPSFLYLPSTGTVSMHHHAQLFTCLLSIELRSLTWVLFNTLQDLLYPPISVWELSLPLRQSRCCGRGDIPAHSSLLVELHSSHGPVVREEYISLCRHL